MIEQASDIARGRAMRNVLIVSPHFPPVNAPDMHRVRLSLPYFREFGWEPIVLTVDPRYVEGVSDELLMETFPKDVSVVRVPALSAKWTRKFGLGNLALRALPYLYAEGVRILQRGKIDLVYFSTTAFPAPVLGRLWKQRFGTRFVVDMQDLWATDYYRDHPGSAQPPKFWFADRLHRLTEPWTMAAVDGLISVSAAYIRTLQCRYPRLEDQPVLTLPFAASEQDMAVARRLTVRNRFFDSGDGWVHGVYVGRGGADMAHALRTIFQSFRIGLEQCPELFDRVRLHFIGTDYAPPGIAKKTIEPIAEEFQLGSRVQESPYRVSYFEALQLLLEADFLLVPGSDDPQYTASKIYPYIMAEKPLLGVFHAASSVCEILRRTRAGANFPLNGSPEDFCKLWRDLLQCRFVKPQTDWPAFAPYLAREMTHRQCDLFDRLVPSANYANVS
jgi:Glycosyl transferase 4-like domain